MRDTYKTLQFIVQLLEGFSYKDSKGYNVTLSGTLDVSNKDFIQYQFYCKDRNYIEFPVKNNVGDVWESSSYLRISKQFMRQLKKTKLKDIIGTVCVERDNEGCLEVVEKQIGVMVLDQI